MAGWVVNTGPGALLVFKPQFPHVPSGDVQDRIVSAQYALSHLNLTPTLWKPRQGHWFP